MSYVSPQPPAHNLLPVEASPQQHVLFRDFETRSKVDLAKVGATRYLSDSSTEILCCGYAVDDGPTQLWVAGEPIPEVWTTAAASPDWVVVAHNDQFESTVERCFGWPSPPLDRHICIAARARAASLPGSLAGAAEACNLPVRKDKAGAAVMKQIAKRKKEPTPEQLATLHDYCKRDIDVLRALYHVLPPLPPDEQAIWIVDQEINRRGFHADKRFATAMRDVALKRQAEIRDELAKLTGGAVKSPDGPSAQKWLRGLGLNLPKSFDKKAKYKLLDSTRDPLVRQVVELVLEGSVKSAAKARSLLASIGDDGRIRDTLLFCGATGGRWSGAGFQPQNMKREDENLDAGKALSAFLRRDMAAIHEIGKPLTVAALVARALVTAGPGKLLMAADYSQVEARLLAWFADEKHVLDDIRKFDETGDEQYEIYCRAASGILKRNVTKANKQDRQVGKTATLALGYGGTLGAWRKFDEAIPDWEVRRHIAGWRDSRPATVRFWNKLDDTLRRAIGEPGTIFTCGRVTAWSAENTLHVQLPSGRVIRYPDADVVEGNFEGSWNVKFKKWQERKWRDTSEWFGKFVAAVVQGTARDLMAAAMLRVAAAGFEIVLTVHDELVVEIREGEANREEEFIRLMTELPPWADGLPVVADARIGKRYLKAEADLPPGHEDRSDEDLGDDDDILDDDEDDGDEPTPDAIAAEPRPMPLSAAATPATETAAASVPPWVSVEDAQQAAQGPVKLNGAAEPPAQKTHTTPRQRPQIDDGFASWQDDVAREPTTWRPNGTDAAGSIEDQVAAHMASLGREVPDNLIADGEFHRHGPKDALWYRIIPLSTGAVWTFGDWRITDDYNRGESVSGRPLTAEEVAERFREQEKMLADLAAERQRKQAEAAAEAQRRWEAAIPAPEDHPYLVKKHVEPCGARLEGNNLLIAMFDIEGVVQSVQEIFPNGRKHNQKGGRRKGCFFPIGDGLGEVIPICEGFSTGCTIHMATGLGVISAGDAGNVGPVAKIMRKLCPEATIVICADDDWKTATGNTGKLAAEEAAKEINGVVCLPRFQANRSDGDTDFNDMAKLYGLETVAQAIEAALEPIGDPPPGAAQPASATAPKQEEPIEPVDLWGHFDPPPLPPGLLPAAIEEFAAEESNIMGADPVGLAMAALTVCAAALPDRVKLQVKKHTQHWKESTRLWMALVGDVSAKKTPIVSRATVAIKKIDLDLATEYENKMEVWEQLSKEEQKLHKPPLPTRLVIQDTTVEAAQEILKGSVDGILKLHDELAGFFGSMERYNSRGGSSDRSFYLESFNGGPIPIDRVKRGIGRIPNLSINVLGGIQPAVARRVASDTVEDGLLQRLIPIMLKEAEAGKDVPGGQAGDRYDALVASLHHKKTPPEPLRFEDAARPIREELERKHMKLQRYYAGFNKRLAAHIGKYDGIFARLCLLWHYIEGANQPAITERTANRVADFMHKFMLPHAVAFYTSILGISDNHEKVSQVAGYILAKKLTRVTSRDIQSGVSALSGLKRHEVEPLCDQLESLGWLFRVQGPRRDSVVWEVNPEVHRKFAERAEREIEERAARRELLLERTAERRAMKTDISGVADRPGAH